MRRSPVRQRREEEERRKVVRVLSAGSVAEPSGRGCARMSDVRPSDQERVPVGRVSTLSSLLDEDAGALIPFWACTCE